MRLLLERYKARTVHGRRQRQQDRRSARLGYDAPSRHLRLLCRITRPAAGCGQDEARDRHRQRSGLCCLGQDDRDDPYPNHPLCDYAERASAQMLPVDFRDSQRGLRKFDQSELCYVLKGDGAGCGQERRDGRRGHSSRLVRNAEARTWKTRLCCQWNDSYPGDSFGRPAPERCDALTGD